MSLLRRIPTPRLLLLLGAICVALASGTALAAGALSGGGSTPPDKPLAQALHDAAAAPALQGVTARISFTNKLIDSSSLGGGAGPLLSGASGRLWAAADGRLRLELQSDRGDAQIVSDGKRVTLYDATSNTAYELTLPAQHEAKDPAAHRGPPSVADIQGFLTRLARTVDVSGATPDNVAGREAYTVKLSPAHDGGLVGAAQLAWDAANGTPLRAAVYAAGSDAPVLELKATDISFGTVSDADLQAPPPAGAKVVKVDLPGHDRSAGTGDRAPGGHGAGKGARGKDASGAETADPKAVAAQLPFALRAPDKLVGLPRKAVRLVSMDTTKGALVLYGAGLGGIAVLEQPASAAAPADRTKGGGDKRGGLSLPKVSIDGIDGQELATALGTLVRFQRGGVQYTILGSVPPAAAEAAARGL